MSADPFVTRAAVVLALLVGCRSAEHRLAPTLDELTIIAMGILADRACECADAQCAAAVALSPVPTLKRPPGTPKTIDEYILSGASDLGLRHYLGEQSRLKKCLAGSEIHQLWGEFRRALESDSRLERAETLTKLMTGHEFLAAAGRLLEADSDLDPAEALADVLERPMASARINLAPLELESVSRDGDNAVLKLQGDGIAVELRATYITRWVIYYDASLMAD